MLPTYMCISWKLACYQCFQGHFLARGDKDEQLCFAFFPQYLKLDTFSVYFKSLERDKKTRWQLICCLSGQEKQLFVGVVNEVLVNLKTSQRANFLTYAL